MASSISPSLRNIVWKQAEDRCEYCRLPQSCTQLPHQVDHIIAEKHHGATIVDNLCLACFYCNVHKGTNIAGLDEDGQLTPLFHPRSDVWSGHFHWDRATLVGDTAIGRVTIDVLAINDPARVEMRELRMKAGDFSPS